MTYNPDPRAPENNLHHTTAFRSEQEWLEDLLGKGPGDPDFHGYPGEPKDEGDTQYGIRPIEPIDLTHQPF